jgi:cysteine synthase A
MGMNTVHEREPHSTGANTGGGKERNSTNYATTEIVLADPQGSSLYHKVAHGVCYAPQQREQKQRKHRYDSIVEGVGLDRVTANFDSAIIDSAESVTDQEMVDMAHWVRCFHLPLFLSSFLPFVSLSLSLFASSHCMTRF